MPPTLSQIEATVQDIVTAWIGALVGQDAATIDTSIPCTGAANSYLTSPGAYASMCDACTTSFNKKFATTVLLEAAWRDAHEKKSIGTFVADAALRVQSSLPTT